MNDCSISETISKKASQMAWEMFANRLPQGLCPGLVPEPGSPNHPRYWRTNNIWRPHSLWYNRPVLYNLCDLWGDSLYVGHTTDFWDRIIGDHRKTKWWRDECFFVHYLDYDFEREDRYITDLEDFLIKCLDPKYNVARKYRKVSEGDKLLKRFLKEI